VVCQLCSVDQHHFLFDASDVFERLAGKRRGCDEDTLARTMPFQTASKRLDRGTAHGAVPALGLHVNEVESQLILFDDAVDAIIAAPTNSASCVLL
jgi:hypothetical protein